MKKKRSVTKRVLAFVLAFAMMFTAMSWEGIGKVVAKADATNWLTDGGFEENCWNNIIISYVC